MPSDKLLTTAEAAHAIGVARSTLARWKSEGIVTPTIETPGGHGRWDVEDLKRQLREKNLPHQAS